MDTDTFLSANQIFTIDEIRSSLEMKKNSSTLYNLLTYHLRQGHIIRIRKGLYYTIPNGIDAETYPIDPYLIASKMTPDAILAYQTALGFHGKLHSLRNDFIYVTQRKLKRPFIFRGCTFKGISIPKGTSAHSDFGVEIVDYQGCKIRVTTLERTFVDILDRPVLIDDWEEIWRSLESIEYLNLQQVLAYAYLLNNATTYARIAFFLDQHRETLGLSEKDLEVFDALKPKSPHYLDLHNKGPNQLVTRWNLVVPKSLLERNWEEPHGNI
jgi:predicted transcriptional regulator of viral defense system